MYSANVSISPLPQSFRHEEAVLKQVGIQVWGQLSQLDELALNQLCSAWPSRHVLPGGEERRRCQGL